MPACHVYIITACNTVMQKFDNKYRYIDRLRIFCNYGCRGFYHPVTDAWRQPVVGPHPIEVFYS